MRNRFKWLISGFTFTGAVALAGCETVGNVVGVGITASLSGAQEVPGSGDPDGRGTAEVTVVDRTDNFCYEVEVANIEVATAAHIHRGGIGQAGPPVIALDAPTDGESNGCLSIATELADEIINNPGGFYVNVHNGRYPAGAVRGQLVR